MTKLIKGLAADKALMKRQGRPATYPWEALAAGEVGDGFALNGAPYGGIHYIAARHGIEIVTRKRDGVYYVIRIK